MEQFKSGLLHFVTRIRDRRYVAVDPERGLVFSFIFFDHSGGDTRTFQTPDGRTVTAGPAQLWTWQLAELFKIEKGKIHQIRAIMERAPYGMNSGWSNWEDGFSDRSTGRHQMRTLSLYRQVSGCRGGVICAGLRSDLPGRLRR